MFWTQNPEIFVQQSSKGRNVFSGKMFSRFWDIRQNVLDPKPGNLCATVLKRTKRVFWENVSPFLGHACVVPFFKLGLESDVIAKNNMKIKKLKAFEM
jgi:hypothetical protein